MSVTSPPPPGPPSSPTSSAAPSPARTRVLVAVGGASGALLRGASVAAGVALGAEGGAIAALLAINVVGAFALGWLVARAVAGDRRVARLLPLVAAGGLGALTSFSALAEQLATMVASGRPGSALLLGTGSLAAGVLAAVVGSATGGRRGGRTS